LAQRPNDDTPQGDATMSTCHCEATDRHFTPDRARADLAGYRRRGPTGTARTMLSALSAADLAAETMLDIGGGIGVLHHELLDRGVRRAVHVEAAEAFLDVARAEAIRRGHEERVEFRHGDGVVLAAELDEADLVTLDRVICCYPELDALITATTRKAR